MEKQRTLDEILEGADYIEYLSYDSEAEYMAYFKIEMRNKMIAAGYRGNELDSVVQEIVDNEQRILDERLPWGEARKRNEHE